MKPENKNIESLLAAGKKTGLLQSEQADMLANLRAYTAFHPGPVNDPNVTSVWYQGFFARSVAVCAILVMIVVGTGSVSSRALPGESLYVIKVDVFEPVFGLTRISKMQQLQYQEDLVETRLFEIQELARTNTLTKQTADLVGAEVAKHGENIGNLLVDNIDTTGNPSETIEVLSNVMFMIKAQEIIKDAETGYDPDSKLNNTSEFIEKLYDAEIQNFSFDSPQLVPIYIEKVLSEVRDSVVDDVLLSNENGIELSDYLNDVSDALATGDITKALEYTGDAEQIVEVSRHVADSEVVTQDESGE